jgi:Tetratricopeptide repeat
MEEQDYKLIDDYFNGLLPETTRAAVEQRNLDDPAFSQVFKQQEELETWLKNEPKRREIHAETAQLGLEYFAGAESPSPTLRVSKPRRLNWMAIAASLALLLAGVWFLMPSTNRDLYAKYAKHDKIQLVDRSVGSTIDLAGAETAFNTKEYAKALPLLAQIRAAEPDNLVAGLYLGICQLETGDILGARASFAPIAAGSSILKSDAQWYMGLSYVKAQNKVEAISSLRKIGAEATRYKSAQELIEALNK